MSHLIAPTYTAVDQIPLGRRIAEIMQEKGSAFTINAMAKRLDINRETLRLMLKGEREIYVFELEKIAKDLKVPVERILQKDEEEKRRRFNEIVTQYTDLEYGAELSDSFLQSAIGITEKFYAMNNKGRYWYVIRDYDRAHETWLETLQIAWAVLEKYDEALLLLKVTGNLSITYANRKENSALLKLVSLVEPYFDENPLHSGIICFSLGRIHESEGELDKTLEKFYQYNSFMEMTKDPNQIMKARYNVAVIEYRMKNYWKAIELLESAFCIVGNSQYYHFNCLFYQEYAKSLLRLGEFERAEQALLVAEEIMGLITIKSSSFLELEAVLFFLMAIAKNDPEYAKKLVHREDLSLNIRKLACKFLIDYYDKTGNFELRDEYQNYNRLRYTGIDMLLLEKEHCPQYLMTLFDLCFLIGWHKI